MRVLLVEDDEALAATLVMLLGKNNYLVDVATDGELGWEMVCVISYDLILLDVNLPKLDGIQLCRRLRNQNCQIPVILMTVQDSVTDKLVGLESGADDYLVKPFNVQELLARIRIVSRRLPETLPTLLSCGKIVLNPQMREIAYDGKVIPFSRKEYLLIELFLRHPHRVFSRSDIVDHLWSLDNLPTEDTVKSHIRRIRRKLSAVGSEDLIETLYGHGYRINPALLNQSHEAEPPLQIQELNQAIGHIWQNIRPRILEQIVILEQTVLTLRSGLALDSDRLALTQRTVHQLAGTVGTCGFEVASHLAQAIEILLQSPIHSASLHSLTQLVDLLRWELEQPHPTVYSDASAGKAGKMDPQVLQCYSSSFSETS